MISPGDVVQGRYTAALVYLPLPLRAAHLSRFRIAGGDCGATIMGLLFKGPCEGRLLPGTYSFFILTLKLVLYFPS